MFLAFRKYGAHHPYEADDDFDEQDVAKLPLDPVEVAGCLRLENIVKNCSLSFVRQAVDVLRFSNSFDELIVGTGRSVDYSVQVGHK